MSTWVTVNLFVEGLVLFVPQANPPQVEVLIVDARTPPHASDGCPIHPHRARFVVEHFGRDCGAVSSHPAVSCERDGLLCRCELTKVDLSFCGEQGESCYGSATKAIDDLREISPPFPPVRVRWLASKLMDGLMTGTPMEPSQIRSREAGTSPGPPYMRQLKQRENLLVARAHLAPQEAKACKTREGKLCMLFRSASKKNFFAYPHMAAEIVKFTLKLQVKAKDGNAFVEIPTRAFDGKGSVVIHVPVRVDAHRNPVQVDLLLANQMEIDPRHQEIQGRCSEDGIGRHFELLYELLDDPASLEDRCIPHQRVRFAENNWLNLRDCDRDQEYSMENCSSPVLDDILDLLRAGEGKPICNGAVGSQ